MPPQAQNNAERNTRALKSTHAKGEEKKIKCIVSSEQKHGKTMCKQMHSTEKKKQSLKYRILFEIKSKQKQTNKN